MSEVLAVDKDQKEHGACGGARGERSATAGGPVSAVDITASRPAVTVDHREGRPVIDERVRTYSSPKI